MWSWLIMTLSLSQAGPPRSGANSKPHQCKKIQKLKDLQKKEFHAKTFWRSQTKKNHTSRLDQTIPWNTWPLKELKTDFVTRKEQIEAKLKKNIQVKTVGTLQDENWEVKSRRVQVSCNIGSSRHCHYRSQDQHVQLQFQSPIITNNTNKKRRTSRKHGFNSKKFEDFRRKKTKDTSIIDRTTPWNTGSPNAAIDDEPCNQWRVIANA